MITRSGEESIICPELAATNQSQFPRVTFPGHDESSLSGGFMESFITLNIINFADVVRREKDIVSWDVRRVSSS